MKTLEISSPVLQRLAQIALFERIQSRFHLYPGKMAAKIKKMATRLERDPQELAAQLHAESREVFAFYLSEAKKLLKHEPSTRAAQLTPFFIEIRDFFDLAPGVMAEGVASKAKGENVDPIEVIEAMESIVPDILLWAFAQTVRILGGENAES